MPNIIYNNRKEDFADWVRNELQQRGWSQADLARACGLTSAAISRLLSGQRNPSVESVKGIARAFNLPVEEVFLRAGFLPESSMSDDPLVCRIHIIIEQLNEEHREELYKYGKFRLQLQREGK